MRLWIAAAAALALLPAARAQMPGMKMPEMQVVPPPEKMPVPIRMEGLGNSHIAITATPEAQAWFDQGLNLMHDFWDYESTKAFEQGVRVDPNCAMCWWGLAKIEGFRGGPEAVYGKAALEHAVKLKKHLPRSERLYIEAARAAAKGKKGGAKEIAKLRELVKQNPADLQARIFLATAVEDGYDDKGLPKAGEKEGIAMLEAILKEAPNDSAANHYWIHAIEPSLHPENAIPSSALLASLAPASGHMVHMPGHIYYRVGDYAHAEHWFAASTAVDERYMHDQNVSAEDDWNYVHNLMYAIANLMEQGKLAEANTLSDRLEGARGKLAPTLYTGSARDSMTRVSHRLPVALRIGDWDAILAMLDATPDAPNLAFLSAQLKDYATGMRALDRGQVAEAEAASAHMDAALEAMRKTTAATPKKAKDDKHAKPMMAVMPDAQAEPLVKTFTIGSLELRAGILAAKGKLDEAKKLYADALKKEKDLGYREPPSYIRPVGETEGIALLRAKDYAAAALAYQTALDERPASGFDLYGLARTKELAGDAPAARTAYAAFLKAWPAADATLPEVMHAREVLGPAAYGQ